MTIVLSNPPAGTGKSVHAAKCIVLQDRIEIPLGIHSLEEFREWARSDAFPDEGRIDYIDGRIEVDMMVENLFYHSSPMSEIFGIIWSRIRSENLGRLFSDRTRISHPAANLSAEPDIAFLSFDSIAAGRVRYIRAQTGDPESFIEIEGTPDGICEIVSDSSVTKDTVRLAEKYFQAGVREYWIVDARRGTLALTVLKRGSEALVAVEPDADGFQASTVFKHRYRFSRDRGPDGHWDYRLDEQPLA